MALTFANIALIIALAVVAYLLGSYNGKRNGYAEGHADGIFAGEKGIMSYLNEEEKKKVEDARKREMDIIIRILNGEW